MNLRRLQMLCQVVDCSLNISSAARALYTSQPSVSRHLYTLEEELGFSIFIRTKKRIVGLTDLGNEVLRSARRVTNEVQKLGQLGKDDGNEQSGHLIIAASHTHARYWLPEIVTKFRKRYPRVNLVLRQGNANQVARWVSTGASNFGISAMPTELPEGLIFFPCHEHHRIILVPVGHPLLKYRRVRLEELAKYPLITYEPPLAFHTTVIQAFASKGLDANIVLSATDVDVMKTYVNCGLGVAIVASLAYEKRTDSSLRAINADHLFQPTMINITLRRRSYLRSFVYEFVHMLAPVLNREFIQRRLSEDVPSVVEG